MSLFCKQKMQKSEYIDIQVILNEDIRVISQFIIL